MICNITDYQYMHYIKFQLPSTFYHITFFVQFYRDYTENSVCGCLSFKSSMLWVVSEPAIWFGSEASDLTPDISSDIPVNFSWGDAGFTQTKMMSCWADFQFSRHIFLTNLCKMFIFPSQGMSRHDNITGWWPAVTVRTKCQSSFIHQQLAI